MSTASKPTHDAPRTTDLLSRPGLYVHLPWCVRKCPYCDFNSHATPDEPLPFERYTAALLCDLAGEAARIEQAGVARALGSIFFGGGTPSLFPADAIARVLDAARDRFGIADDAEITLEANPGTIEHGRFDDLRAAGVNRISLGAQSFDARALKKLGRIHGPQEIFAAIDEIRRAGFDDVNVDLMYALPDQSARQASNDVRALIDLAPSHISHYQLTLEPNTVFYSNPPALPDDDRVHAMQTACTERLADAGYRQYEVSAYGLGERRGRHNLNYWRFGDYVGIGAGAHGKLTLGPDKSVERSARSKHPMHYMTKIEQGESAARRHRLTAPDLVFEYALNVLRLYDEPLDLAQMTMATGLAPAAMHAPIAAALSRGLMRDAGNGRYPLTDLGRRFLNDLQALFLPNRGRRNKGG